MRKQARLVFLIGLLLLACKQVFLDQATISSLTVPETRHHQVIYFDKRFTVDEFGRLTIATHSLLQVGEDVKSAPELFYIFDGSVEKLIDFQARIAHATGASKTYDKSDLLTQDLSNKQIISELQLKFLPIAEACSRGDLVEVFTLHEQRLPPLGMRFSLAEINNDAHNISCSIQLPAADSLQFQVKNCNASPKITSQGRSRIYQFTWDHYSPVISDNIFEKRNRAPEVLASMPRYNIDAPRRTISISNWRDFGNWYLELITPRIIPDDQVKRLASTITAGKMTPRAKMDAIFEYCQRTIRYEQVYLEKGEVVPNTITNVLSRKFGDCKDYAVAIYGLASSVGLNPHLALCYRGRGLEFYPQMAVSQFNHMLVHFEDNGTDLWYDATNRIGLPGITTIDLMNQTALVLEKNNSRLIKVSECPANKLAIDGQFKYSNRGLVGELKISLFAQYAIDLFYAENYTNRAEFIKVLVEWLNRNINKEIMVQSVDYRKEALCFIVQIKCEIPNSVLEIDGLKYLSLARIFNRMFPGPDQKMDANKLFYFPFYNRVDINLNLLNLSLSDRPASQPGFLWHYDYELPAGPFDANQKSIFLTKFEAISREFHRTQKFIEREAL